jgi:hypothetical protein
MTSSTDAWPNESAVGLEELLAELRGSRTDLARFVEAAARSRQPYLVVPAQAVRAWRQREPALWTRVTAWLSGRGIAIVEI